MQISHYIDAMQLFWNSYIRYVPQMAGQVAFDEFDGVGGDAGHVIPEALAGQLLGADLEEASQGGALEPARHLDLAAGSDTAVDGGQEQVG